MSHNRPSQTSHDVRVRRTRQQLRAALTGLAGERGYESVTVGDISRQAQVNRATFYRHYEDKEDLAADVLAQMVDEVIGPAPLLDGTATVDFDSRIDGWSRLFEHFADHRRLYQPLLVRRHSRRFIVRARAVLSGVARERIDAVQLAPDQARMPEELVGVLAVEAFLGAVEWWLERGIPHPPRQMATWFMRFVALGYFNALGLDDLISQTSRAGPAPAVGRPDQGPAHR